MSKKMPGKKTIDKLARIIANKITPEDKVTEVTRQVLADYFEAKKSVAANFKSVKQEGKKKAKPAKPVIVAKSKKQGKKPTSAQRLVVKTIHKE